MPSRVNSDQISTKDDYWRAEIIDYHGNHQILYGVAFKGHRVRNPSNPGLGSVDHVSLMRGMGKLRKVVKLKIFKDGETWYRDQYGEASQIS